MAFLLNSSRFSKTDLILSRSNKSAYGRMDGFDAFKNIAGENITLETIDNSLEGRPDLIAFNFYGDSHLEWVIVIANAPKNPLNWPRAGEVIKVPTSDYVRSNL